MFYIHTNNQELLTNFVINFFILFVSAWALFLVLLNAKIAFFYLFPKRSVFLLSLLSSPDHRSVIRAHPCYPWFVPFREFRG